MEKRTINRGKPQFRVNRPHHYSGLTHSYKLLVISDPETKVTQATIQIGDRAAVGSAKCHPNDLWNQEIGEAVAITRALNAMTETMQEKGNHLIEINNARTWLWKVNEIVGQDEALANMTLAD